MGGERTTDIREHKKGLYGKVRWEGGAWERSDGRKGQMGGWSLGKVRCEERSDGRVELGKGQMGTWNLPLQEVVCCTK